MLLKTPLSSAPSSHSGFSWPVASVPVLDSWEKSPKFLPGRGLRPSSRDTLVDFDLT